MTTATESPPDSATDEAPEAAAAAPPPPPDRDRPRKTVFGIGLTDSTRHRLRDCGFFDVVDDPENAGDADLVAVSTRIPPGRSAWPTYVTPLPGSRSGSGLSQRHIGQCVVTVFGAVCAEPNLASVRWVGRRAVGARIQVGRCPRQAVLG